MRYTPQDTALAIEARASIMSTKYVCRVRVGSCGEARCRVPSLHSVGREGDATANGGDSRAVALHSRSRQHCEPRQLLFRRLISTSYG